MKQQTISFATITILCIIGEVLSPKVPFNKESSVVQPLSDSNTWSDVISHHEHKCHDDSYHKRRKKRCKRYVQNYYGRYIPASQYYAYGYGLQGPVYTPPRCYNYCYSCPNSSCRRRCPKPTPPATIVIRPTNPPEACNCDPKGSKYQPCDPSTGYCMCKTNYTGRACNICKDGYWKNANGECIKCQCNEFGSKDSNCNKTNGQCNCSQGVQGVACDQCLPNYYGTVDVGCIKCEPCDKEGHICGKGGKCICPPLTAGLNCERCIANAWGHRGIDGCQACNCSSTGSVKLQCDKNSGICICKSGFEGEKCNRCSVGYYGYPNCQKCNCNPSGTELDECKGDSCRCSDDGVCKCKKYVHGNKCDKCKEGTFGMNKEHAFGCTKCFCFTRSTKCIDSNYNWDKIQFQKPIESNEPVSNSDILSLPRQFLGDRTISYDGYLTVNEKASRDGQFSVTLHGNGIKLHSGVTINSSELKLNENYWRIVSSNNGHCRTELSKECFMLVLQNVTAIIVEGRNIEIREVLLDVAKADLLYNRPSHSIEKCKCPPEYTGLSCQDPNDGFYRHVPRNNHWIDDVIGISRPCECNGHSHQCDPGNGYCKNCADFRDGKHCELCAAGYYMDHNKDCLPCLCPSIIENNARSCVARNYDFVCICKEGYTGVKCEQCSPGYFRDPVTNKCVPCNCNFYGSYLLSCDKYGTCNCKPGFKGQKCNQCHNDREYIKGGVCVPCDECAQLLFNDIDKLTKAVDETFGLFENGIAPPWKKLADITKKNNILFDKFEEKAHQLEKIMKDHNITEYENKIEELRSKEQLQNKIARDLEEKSNSIKNSSNVLQLDLENLKTKLQETIDMLENFGTQHVSVKDAIKKAKKILRAMQEIGVTFERFEGDTVFQYCSDINRLVNSTYGNASVLPEYLINNLTKKLIDIEKITVDVAQQNAIADDLNNENSERLERLKIRLKTVNEENDNTQNHINEIIDKLGAINDTFHKLEQVYNDMKKFKFDDIEKLELRLKRDMDSIDGMDDILFRATQHAEELEKTVLYYKSIFNFTKDEWKTIKASGSYEEIVKGIKKAKDDANEAARILQNATSIINPTDSDGLIDKANLAHAYSDRLKKRIANLKNMSSSFNAIKNKLEEFKYKLLESGKANNDLTQLLNNMEVRITSQNDLVDQLYNAIDNSTDISEKMRQIEKELYNLSLASRYDLFKKYKTYLALISKEEMDKLKRNLSYAREELNSLELNMPITDDTKKLTQTEGQANLDHIRERIRELQNKVQYAKQAADSIDIAMGLTSNCTMTYRIPQSEVFRSLSITYNCRNCHLFKWSNNRGDYLSLVIIEEEAVVDIYIDNKQLKLRQPSVTDGEKIITVERIGSNVELRFNSDQKVTGSIGNGLLTIYETDDIVVGSENSGQNSAYVYKISLNSYNIGLWKFAKTRGQCVGKARVSSKIEEEGRPFYVGNGYRSYNLHSNQRPSEFSLQFKIATFDENSLIYLAQEKENPCAFIAVYLREGYVVLKVRHNNNQQKILKGAKKINNGKTNTIELTMTYSGGKQHYKLNNVSEIDELDRTHVFKIRKANQYVGGVSPTFDGECIQNEVNTTSFLGFLSSSELINYNSSYGVVWQSGELNLNKVWFNGNGYLKVSKEVQPKASSKLLFSFILRPIISDGVIMHVSKLGVISLVNKRLSIEFSKLGNQISYTSSNPLIINDYNVIVIDVKKENVTISVNGEREMQQARGRIKLEEIEIAMGKKDDEHGSYYRGGISDIIVNNMTFFLNDLTVKEFSNVEIGREPPIKRLPTPQVKGLILPTSVSNSMQNTEGCALTGNFIMDSSAVKFGDKQNSFIKIKTTFWRKNFTIGLEFRTFYPNGVMFLSTGGTQHQHYNFLELKEGRLNLFIKGKRRRKENMPISMHEKVNDGKWHKLYIVKKARHLTMSLDGERSKPVRVPKNRVKNEIWLGGIPRDYTDYRELKDKLHSFRGCMKSLVINNESQNLMKNNKDILAQNITQCFPYVEEGAYFGGDAYALYRKSFQVNKILELGFEFRTAEQNGILLSASNSNNSPALSVELQNGAVVMTVDMGNGIISKATNNLDSEFALCDNRWHNVTALYSTSELTVNVDGIRKSWVHDVNSLMEEIDAPLYIGGIPDDAPYGTLKVRENFKGCIRKLMIEDGLMDWSDMEKLNHVLLNSCPIVPGEE